jgi:hypothetical protein
MNANLVAFNNANAAGLPQFAEDGLTPIVYNQIPNIRAADVQPPAWLNIVPEIVNKVATERDVRAVNPQGVIPVPLGAAVSVVNPAAAADPQLPGTLQALLNNDEWGNAFIGLVQDIRTPIPITTASIDSIFTWGESVPGPTLCRDSYVQAMIGLLQLPSGVRLFRDIIIAHHCLPDLPKVEFISTDEESSATVFDYPKSCKINLEWDDASQRHVGSKRIVIAKDNALAPVPGNPGAELEFITAHVPPSVVLAHELGHYLDDLMACKKVMDTANHVGIVSEAIAPALPSRGVKTSYGEDMFHISWGVKARYPQYGYTDVLRRIIQNPPNTAAENAFIDLWDNGVFSEMVNILPIASILNDGGSSYSDGIVMGEACLDVANGVINQRLYFTRKINGDNRETDVNVGAVALSPESFVRLGHTGAKRFWEVFNGLGLVDQVQFKDLTATMLSLINDANGQPLSAANNNLPNF